MSLGVDDGNELLWIGGKGSGALRTRFEACAMEGSWLGVRRSFAGDAGDEVLYAAEGVAKEEASHCPIDD